MLLGQDNQDLRGRGREPQAGRDIEGVRHLELLARHGVDSMADTRALCGV